MRGIPSPGQLRPDLDPVQLSRALKRMKSRKPILDIGAGAGGPSEEPAETPATPIEKPAKVEAKAEPPTTAKPLPHEDEDASKLEAEHPETPEKTKESLSKDGPVTAE
jgi:hypothetical protein